MEKGLLNGRLDSPLSVRGKLEARLVAERLRGECFDAFYTSPLGRARETSAAIALAVGQEPVIAEELREVDFGWLEGRPLPLFAKRPSGSRLRQSLRLPFILATQAVVAVSGERWNQVFNRVERLLQRVVQDHPSGRVLLVSHSAVHYAILRLTLNLGSRARTFLLDPCGITELDLESAGHAVSRRINDTQHLQPLASQAQATGVNPC